MGKCYSRKIKWCVKSADAFVRRNIILVVGMRPGRLGWYDKSDSVFGFTNIVLLIPLHLPPGVPALWILIVVGLFSETFYCYDNEPQYSYLRKILGKGLCISRGTATVINVCGALILLPVCKKLNQLMFRLLSKMWPNLLFFWLQKAKSCHITIGITMFVFSIIHSCAHVFNICNFSNNYDETHSEINWASNKNQSPFILLFLTLTGATGLSLLCILTFMAIASTRSVRESNYNAFWYTHHLFLPLTVLFIVHPLSGVLKEQVMTKDVHDDFLELRNSTMRSPEFIPIKSKTWKWMFLSLCCCAVDTLWRVVSRNKSEVMPIEAKCLPGNAVYLRLSCPFNDFKCEPGQYILLQCSDISRIEWHAFTVTQVPSSSQCSLSLLIKVSGDWTRQLYQKLKNGQFANSYYYHEDSKKPLRFLLDGPYASRLQRVCSAGAAVCVAAGGGITAYTALMYQLVQNPSRKSPERLHLIWICREVNQITWFADLLVKLHHTLWESNQPDRFQISIFLTKDSHKVAEDLLQKSYTILSCRITRGRPRWDTLFEYWLHLYPRQNLSLFCCGPRKLTQVLGSYCRALNVENNTIIELIREGFS